MTEVRHKGRRWREVLWGGLLTLYISSFMSRTVTFAL